jgi:hypothetical protein
MRSGNIITSKLYNMRFIDTLNFSPSSVENLGKLIGIGKLKHPKFLGQIPKNNLEWRYLKEYNSKDCLISKTFIEQFQKFLNEELKTDLKLTIASTSLNLYRRNYMPIDIYKEHMPCKKFIYKSYYGGRVECFKRGCLNPKINQGKKYNKNETLYNKIELDKIKGTTFYMYDFNSLYPSVMCNKYPLPSSAKLFKNRSGKLDKKYIKEYEGVSDVIVECPYMYYPLLPYRDNDKLIFPIGTFRGVYTHLELRKALKLGYKIKKCFKTLFYTKTFYPFKTYVMDLYKRRLKYQKDNNIIYATMIKTLLNSLYGKFATKNFNEFTFLDMDNTELQEEDFIGAYMDFKHDETGKIIKGTGRRGYKENEKECNQNYILPILSSYTTAYGRIKLYDSLVKLNAIYCDTDSILTTKKIESSKELGELKLEKISRIGYIVKPKFYRLFNELDSYDIIKVKGVRKVDLKTFEDILNHKRVQQLKFTKLKESIRQGYKPNHKRIYYKLQDLQDNKRNWEKRFNKKELQDSTPININDTTNK